MHSITIPGKLYSALMERDAFTSEAPEDHAALKAMQEATSTKRGRGYQYHLVGSKATLEHILGYIGDLPGVAAGTGIPISEFGTNQADATHIGSQLTWKQTGTEHVAMFDGGKMTIIETQYGDVVAWEKTSRRRNVMVFHGSSVEAAKAHCEKRWEALRED